MNNGSSAWKDLLERDADKIALIAAKRKHEWLEPEWVLLAEFNKYYGWEALKEARFNREFSFAEMNKLISAARRIESIDRYNMIMDIYAATIAVHDKGKSLKQTLKTIRDSLQ